MEEKKMYYIISKDGEAIKKTDGGTLYVAHLHNFIEPCSGSFKPHFSDIIVCSAPIHSFVQFLFPHTSVTKPLPAFPQNHRQNNGNG